MIEHHREQISVEALCEILHVSPGNYPYYASRNREERNHQRADGWLGQEIERVFLESRRTYGSDQVHQQLRQEGMANLRQASSPPNASMGLALGSRT